MDPVLSPDQSEGRAESGSGMSWNNGDEIILLSLTDVTSGGLSHERSGGWEGTERRSIIATNESPKSLADSSLFYAPLTLFVGHFRLGRCRWRLGLLHGLGEGRPRVLAREMEDSLPAGHLIMTYRL
jgi:hypothetical protein